ncbi:MAG: PAS domain S-box protein [Massilia sp.]
MKSDQSPASLMSTDRLVASIRDYAIYMLSPEGTVVSWNAGAQRFKGYQAHEVIGKHFSMFHTPPDQQAGVPAQALATARREGKFECEGWRVRKDGSRFWASVVIDPVYGDDGPLLGYAKITRDITDKKRANDALFASEQQFRLLVQGVVDYAIYMISPDGIVTNWNNGARRIKGYEAEEIVGQHFSRFYTPEDQARALPAHALRQAASAGRYEAEGWRVRKDGTRFWANVVIDALRADDGSLIGFAKVTRDITEKRDTQQSLERAREELFQSQKMESIGQLTGGVAHDFNNLLSIISSAVQVLQMRGGSGPDRAVLQTIERAVERGAGLTQQLLAFARQQPLAPSVHDLNALIANFETVLRRAVSAGITLRLHLAPTVNFVNIDEARFEAALLNLIVNARDAMPAGGEIVIESANRRLAGQAGLTDGEYVEIIVRDSGEGMPPEVLARVFDPFFTTKPVGKGTGLGLSQVHGFIVQSGGMIDVASTPGQGTTFRLLLPAAAAERGAARAEAAELVLIVEDEVELGLLAGSLFETLGYEVIIVNDGQEALGVLAQDRAIDVLFTDVMMPGMSGIDLARQAQAMRPQLKVILASGFPMSAMKADGVAEFASVTKPYRLSEIVKKLR